MGGGGMVYSGLLPRWPRVRADHCPGGRGRSSSLRGTSALPSGPRQSDSGSGRARTSSASLRPRGRPPPRLSPGARPPHHPAVSLFSDVTLWPRPSTPTLPPHLRLHPAASKAPADQGSPRGPTGAAPPCALPNLPLLFQLPSSPRLRHRGGLQNAERGAATTPGIRSGSRAEASPACAGRGVRACARVCVQPGLRGR